MPVFYGKLGQFGKDFFHVDLLDVVAVVQHVDSDWIFVHHQRVHDIGRIIWVWRTQKDDFVHKVGGGDGKIGPIDVHDA